MSDEFDGLDGLAQAELVRRGEVKPIELVDAAIARAEAVNGTLNAIIHPRYERARAEADDAPPGPLHGVPMVHKDLDGTIAGEPYHGGNARLKALGHIAGHDSHLAGRFRSAGLVCIGRTNTPELGLLPTTEPVAYGPTRNPWNLEHSTGGSSGGSAAAVAAGVVPIGHAGDGGGSIRIPASECGLVGLFPSRGRTSLGPDIDEAWGGFVRRHVLTRTVRDSAAVLDAVHGWMPGDPYTAPAPGRPFLDEVGVEPGRLRIGVCTAPPSPYAVIDPACIAAAEAVARVLDGAGHDVAIEDTWLLDEAGQQAMGDGFATAYGAFGWRELLELGELTGSPITEADVEPTTWFIAEVGRAVSAGEYLEAMRQLSVLTRRMAAWWTPDGGQGHDLLVTPTLTVPPPRLGWMGPDEEPLEALIRASSLTAYTMPFNVTGQPAISLPLHTGDDGLPVGVQLVAAYGREDLLLQVAGQLEALTPWAERRPSVHA